MYFVILCQGHFKIQFLKYIITSNNYSVQPLGVSIAQCTAATTATGVDRFFPWSIQCRVFTDILEQSSGNYLIHCQYAH